MKTVSLGSLQQVLLSFRNVLQGGQNIVTCKICGETLKTPMMLQKCSHVFCSLCIRRWFDSNCICPECRIPSSTGELYKVRLVEDIVELWNTLTNEAQVLNQLITENQFHLDRFENVEEHPSCSRNTSLDLTPVDTVEKERVPPDTESKEYQVETPKKNQRKRKRNPSQEGRTSQKIAECPICGIHISIRLIQHHVDICLTKQSYSRESIKSAELLTDTKSSVDDEPSEASLHASFEKRPTTLWYKNLSDKKLKDILHYYGLSTKGDRNALIRRHKEFVFRYNAELDSKFPRPVSSVIKDIEEWEKQQEWMNVSEEASKLPLGRPLPVNNDACHIVSSDFESLVQQAKRTRVKTGNNFCASNFYEESMGQDDISVFTQQDSEYS